MTGTPRTWAACGSVSSGKRLQVPDLLSSELEPKTGCSTRAWSHLASPPQRSWAPLSLRASLSVRSEQAKPFAIGQHENKLHLPPEELGTSLETANRWLNVQYLVSNAVQLPGQLLASHPLSLQEEGRLPGADPAPRHRASSKHRLF